MSIVAGPALDGHAAETNRDNVAPDVPPFGGLLDINAMSTADAALAYASIDIPVLPVWWTDDTGACGCEDAACRSRGKHPITALAPNGRDSATTNPATLRWWWETYPQANVALAFGEAAVVVDVDPKDGGDATLAPFEPLPPTPMERTPSGGRHYLFRQRTPGELRNGVGKTRKGGPAGLDTRTEGGYIVAAPSVIAGRRYWWEQGGAPVVVPDALADALLPPARATSTATPGEGTAPVGGSVIAPLVEAARARIRTAAPGGRHDALFNEAQLLAGYCMTAGVDPEGVVGPLTSAGVEVYGIEADLSKIERTVREGLRVGAARPPVALPPMPEADVVSMLSRTKGGAFRPTLVNLRRILENDSRWRGRFRLNELNGDVTMVREGGALRSLDDDDATDIAGEVAAAYPGCDVMPGLVWTVVKAIARGAPYHPFREYLDGLPAWDGVPRLDAFIRTYVAPGEGEGEDEDDRKARDRLHAAYGRCFFTALVARTLRPGCKVDNVLVFAGPQGLMKSTAFRAIATGGAGAGGGDVMSGLFSDSDVPMDDPKRLGMVLRGRLLIEFAEFAGVSKRDADGLKRFLAQQDDTFVPMHGRAVVTQPRRVMFCATYNPDGDEGFLTDAGRRWWVVEVAKKIDVGGILAARDALFAEAVHRFGKGEPWWLPADLEAAQAADTARHAQRNPLTEIAETWWAEKPAPTDSHGYSMAAVVRGLLDMDVKHADTRQQRGVGAALRALGWTKKKVKNVGQRWTPPAT